METKETLKKRLRQIEDKIQEITNRLPAHSTKPVMMMELIELEDERENILAQLQKAANQSPQP